MQPNGFVARAEKKLKYEAGKADHFVLFCTASTNVRHAMWGGGGLYRYNTL
jgi:hypothetical protein